MTGELLHDVCSAAFFSLSRTSVSPPLENSWRGSAGRPARRPMSYWESWQRGYCEPWSWGYQDWPAWDGDAWTGREGEEWAREWDEEISRRSRGWTQISDDDSSDNSLRRGNRGLNETAAGWLKKERVSSDEEAEKKKKEFGPSLQESVRMAKAGLKEGPKVEVKNEPEAAAASSTSKGPERRPAFVPEHRPGEADWDPFWQEARGKKSRETRKQRRLKEADVQERKEKGLKEGFPPEKVQYMHEGSRKWRMLKAREKELREEQEELLLERKQLLAERARFLEEKANWAERSKSSPSPEEPLVLIEGPGARPERRPKRRQESTESSQRPERRPKNREPSASSYTYDSSEEEEQSEQGCHPETVAVPSPVKAQEETEEKKDGKQKEKKAKKKEQQESPRAKEEGSGKEMPDAAVKVKEDSPKQVKAEIVDARDL